MSAARTMLVASGLTTLGAIPPFLVGAQAVLLQRDLGFGAVGLGVAVSAFFAVAALATLSAGHVFDRWASTTKMLVAGSLVALGGLAVGVFVRDWTTLVLAMAVLGAGNAACQGTSNTVVATVLPPHRRGLGFGIKQSAVPAAVMFGGLAVPTATALFGWRGTFLVTASCGLTVVLAALVAPGGSGGGATVSAPTADVERAPLGPLVLCAVAITFASASANFLGAYLASWAHSIGLTVGQAGLLMAAGSAGSILVRVVIGHRADHRFGGNLSVVAAQVVVGGVCLVCIGLMPWVWAVVVFGLLAFCIGWSWPGLFLYAVARVGRDVPGHASSIVQAGAFAGGAIGPALLGVVIAEISFATAWLVAGGGLFMAGLLVLRARTGFRRDLVSRPPRAPFGYGGGRASPRWVTGGAPGAGADHEPVD